MPAIFWSNVAVAVQSALGAGVTINAISKANPGLVEYTGTDPADGNFVLFDVTGMHQLDGRIARVDNEDTVGDDFDAEGINTTSFETFAAGSFYVITFGVSMTTATGVNVTGGDPNFADITTIHDNIQKQVPVNLSPMTMTFDCLFDATDPALVELKLATDTLTTRAIKLTFANGTIIVFNGYIAASLFPTGSAQEAVRTTVTITAESRLTIYSA